jgi:hypothetical protein
MAGSPGDNRPPGRLSIARSRLSFADRRRVEQELLYLEERRHYPPAILDAIRRGSRYQPLFIWEPEPDAPKGKRGPRPKWPGTIQAIYDNRLTDEQRLLRGQALHSAICAWLPKSKSNGKDHPSGDTIDRALRSRRKK